MEKKHMKSDKERSNGRDMKQIWYIQQEFSTSLFTNFIQKVCFFSNGFDFWCIYIKCDYSHFYHQNKSLYIYTVYNLFSIAISKQIKIHSCINIFYFCLNCILGQIKVEGKTSLLILPHLKRDQNKSFYVRRVSCTQPQWAQFSTTSSFFRKANSREPEGRPGIETRLFQVGALFLRLGTEMRERKRIFSLSTVSLQYGVCMCVRVYAFLFPMALNTLLNI